MPKYLKNSASQIFAPGKVLTVPNLMSFFRLLLIPAIVLLYVSGHPHWAAVAFGVSALTDVLDGWVARKFNQTSDLGKILDPVADKLTQVSVLVCLLVKFSREYPTRFPWMAALMALLVVKEIIQAVMGYLAISRAGAVNSANWYGKMATVILTAVALSLLLIPGMPDTAAFILMGVAAAALLLSLVMYIVFFGGVYRRSKEAERSGAK